MTTKGVPIKQFNPRVYFRFFTMHSKLQIKGLQYRTRSDYIYSETIRYSNQLRSIVIMISIMFRGCSVDLDEMRGTLHL